MNFCDKTVMITGTNRGLGKTWTAAGIRKRNLCCKKHFKSYGSLKEKHEKY